MEIKKLIKSGFKYMKNPAYRFAINSKLGMYRYMPDEEFLKRKFKYALGYDLNLDNPQTFNEKIQWLKLYDRNPEYTVMVDKYKVREYVAQKLGEQYLVPLLGVWDDPDEIDFNDLPEKFVLKCNHNSGLGMCICKNKSKLDVKKVKKELRKGLKQDYYLTGREWSYKDVPRKIICEEFLEDPGKLVPEDYKIYCMNGEPRYIVVFHNRFDSSKELSETVYDVNWNPQKISLDEHFKVSDLTEPKPECLDELLRCARVLCVGMAQARIDFYIVRSKIYFGEITLYTAGGFQKMIPEKMDRKLGELVDLSIVKDKNKRGGGLPA